MYLVHEGCGTRHITVGGAGNDLRNALAIASDGVHRGQSRALSVASRAGVSLETRDKCGLGHLRPDTDGTGPGERQRRRGGELRGVFFESAFVVNNKFFSESQWHFFSFPLFLAEHRAKDFFRLPRKYELKRYVSLLLEPRVEGGAPPLGETQRQSAAD